ncbi:kinase-like domain-containing protein [Mycena floridula]|nr:kinase-like domain-containing protein [Mycena floridula]
MVDGIIYDRNLVDHINLERGHQFPQPLLPAEVTFRFTGNRLPIPGTTTRTLHEFYHMHSQSESAPIYLVVPTIWKTLKVGKTPLICLELYVDERAWRTRTGYDEDTPGPGPGSSIGTKRTGTIAEPPIGNKRTRLGQLQESSLLPRSSSRSEFRLSSISGPAPVVSSSKVALKQIICRVDTIEGTPEFEDQGEIIVGAIRNQHFAKGGMKLAFDFVVAKCFFRIDDNTPAEDDLLPEARVTVNSSDNQCHLERELARLSMGQWFLTQFIKAANKERVTIFSAITFASAYLGQELERGSTASGQKEAGYYWLIETKRSTTVEHYTYTLQHHSERNDLKTLTIHAFAHFTFEHSHESLVFADLQGSPAFVRGKDGIILFDPMTHTITGLSGIGDFGVEGITSFLRTHECNIVCKDMGLQTLPDVVVYAANLAPPVNSPPSPGDHDEAEPET